MSLFSCLHQWTTRRLEARRIARRRTPCCRLQVEALDARCLPSFVPSWPIAGGAGPGTIAVGDFNNDKNLDVASITRGDMGVSTLYVQLGSKGGKSFSSTKEAYLGFGATALAAGNFNGDKYLDLIATNTDSQGFGYVLLLTGNGDGTFTLSAEVPVGANPQALALGDFNGDGKLDAVVICSETDVLFGNGKGGFTSIQNVGPGGVSLAVGDFNGDGKLDIVSGGSGSPTTRWGMQVQLGNGDGTFRATQSFAMPGLATSIALADVNGDGKLDIVTATESVVGETDLLVGKGDGTFRAAQAVGPAASAVAVADINGDGKPDIVSVNTSYTDVEFGNGNGTFQAPVTVAAGGTAVAVADFNNDGYVDLAVDGAAVLLNNKRW
jgi:hypothetical protein